MKDKHPSKMIQNSKLDGSIYPNFSHHISIHLKRLQVKDVA